MWSSIWTQCAGASEIRPRRLAPWRVVEAQHQVSTRKLVATDAEQALLEELIESVKPPDATAGRLHYLLSTPFRYPSLRHGSRFARRGERGVWYGADEIRTAFAEAAYYRLLFLEGTSADLGAVETQLTVFRAAVRTQRGVDLTLPPFDAFRGVLAAKDRYDEPQALGAAMRADSVEVFRFESARDVAGGRNVGVLSPAAFGRARPRDLQTWHCTATRGRVEMVKRDYFERSSFAYPREDFLVGGRLPAPAL
jgi:hypothetical protein